MYCDAPLLVQLAAALVTVGVTAVVVQRLGMAMHMRDAPMSTPRFWWTLAIFMAPLGAVSRVLFCDGLFLQLTLIVLIAGGGIWVGDRFLTRR